MKKLSCVLIVEDDPISVFIALRVIKAMDISKEIKVVKNGAIALEYLESKSNNNLPAPELILLDLNVPVKDGYEFFTSFTEMSFVNKSQVISCVLTNSHFQSDINTFFELGVHEYISKPLTKDSVEDIYNKYFQK